MKYRKGQTSNAILNRVIAPLVERGYLTWSDVGYQGRPDEQNFSEGVNPFNDKVEAAVKRFQHDNGIHGDAQHSTEVGRGTTDAGHASGVVGNRTLAALGQHVDPLEVQTLVARNLREHAAQVAVDSNGDAQATAQRIAGIRQAFPTMGPKVTAALGLTGYGKDDDITRELAKNAMSHSAKPFWQTIPTEGDTAKNEGLNGNLVDQWGAAIQDKKPPTHPDQPDAPDHGDQGIVGDVMGAVKGASRGVFSALETPFQALTGAERNAVRGVAAGAVAINDGAPPISPQAAATQVPDEAANYSGVGKLASGGGGVSAFDQSSGGIIAKDLAAGKRVDLGTGFFPGGQVEEEQAANARQALSVAGHAATPGRLAAALVTQPGTQPYKVLSGLVDAGNIMLTDPSNIVLSEVSDIREAQKTLTAIPEVADDATGLVNGIRRTILPQSAERWLTQSRAGQAVVSRLALPESEKGGLSFLETLKAVNGDSDLALQLHNAESPGDVMDALRPKLGITMTEKPSLPYQVTSPWRDVTNGWRWTGSVPDHVGDLKNMDATVKNADNWLRNGKVSLADRNTLTKDLAAADGREEQYQVLKRMAGAVEGSLVDHGMHPADAKGLTKLFDTWDEYRHFMIDEAGNDVSPFYQVDGEAFRTKTPAYFVDFLNRTVPFPNIRPIREATDMLSHVRDKAGIVGAAGEGLTKARHVAQFAGDEFNNIWKPLVLARVGFPLRVIAESQAAMAMAGHESLFSHPIHFITQLVTSPKTDIAGKSFAEMAEHAATTGEYNEYVDAMAGWSRQFITNSDEYGRRLKGWQVIDMETDPVQGARAWHERLARLSTDAIAPEVAKVHTLADLDALKQRFWSGDLATTRREMIAGPEAATYQLTSPSGANTYIDNIAEDIKILTQSDPELKRALAERKATINGKEVSPFGVSKGGLPKLDRDFAQHLKDRVARGDSPPKMIGQVTIGHDANLNDKWNKATTFMFDHLVTQPTNKLTYSPLFREAYYKHVGELAAQMSPADREKAALALEANAVGREGKGKLARLAEGHVRDQDIADRIRSIEGPGLGDKSAVVGTTGFYPTVKEPGDEAFVLSAAADDADLREDAYGVGTKYEVPVPSGPTVTVYRAVPKGVTEIKPGEPVSLSERYAEDHLASHTSGRLIENPALVDGGHIISRTLQKNDLIVAGGNELYWAKAAPRTLSFAQVDKLAKIQALDTVKGTIHDLAHRGQAFDIFRNIAPFGEAWKQVLTRWAKITYNHPETLRKFQIGLEGARGAGFFYTDPATGQELFNYPGSKELTNAMFGVPVPLTGAVSGLNIAGNGLPGVGPVVQMGVGAIVPHTPTFDMIHRYVSPFGDKADPSGNPFKTLVDYTVPSWMGKMITAVTGNADSDVNFAHAVMAQQRYLMTTGEYGNSVTEQRRLVDDATSNAHKFSFVRGLASLTGPAAPIPQAGVLDKDGNFMMQLALSDEYRKDQDAGEREGRSYDDIDQDFIAKYGQNIYMAMQPYTRALVQSLPVTKSQETWARKNSDVVTKYPNVYGFFTPPSKPNEKFDEEAYQRQVKNGERQPISPKTWRRLANDRIASHLYYAARDEMGDHPTDAQATELRTYHDYLLKELPGFESDEGLVGKASPDEVVTELRTAVADPKLRNTKTGKTVKAILAARDEVTADAAKAGIHTVQGWQTSNRALPLRQDLADYYTYLRKEDPGASRILDSVFANDTRGT